MSQRDELREAIDEIHHAAGEVSAYANRIKLGIMPAPASTASANVVTGSTTVGLIGIFAVVVAVAAVLVVAAWRDADARVFEARAAMQSERNEAVEDRLGILEAQVRRLNRETEKPNE